jgi:hypothetical protein
MSIEPLNFLSCVCGYDLGINLINEYNLYNAGLVSEQRKATTTMKLANSEPWQCRLVCLGFFCWSPLNLVHSERSPFSDQNLYLSMEHCTVRSSRITGPVVLAVQVPQMAESIVEGALKTRQNKWATPPMQRRSQQRGQG